MKFTVDEFDDIYDSEQVDVRSIISDFAVLLGGKKDRTNSQYEMFTRDSIGGRKAERSYSACGGDYFFDWYVRRYGSVRPIMTDIDKKFIVENGKKIGKDLYEVTYGNYPQSIVPENKQKILDYQFSKSGLIATGNTYTTDSKMPQDKSSDFEPQTLVEYEYQGERYVRLKSNTINVREIIDGQAVVKNNFVWVKVEPISWIANPKKQKMITRDAVFAGVQFSNEKYARDEYIEESSYQKTNMNHFIEECFSKDIQQEVKIEKPKKVRRSRFDKLNPDVTAKEDRSTMSDTELIHNWIENGESVLLRGASGIGKTQRIRSMYPDVIELKLTNNMFPEKVVGSTNLQTGEEVPPNYVKQIIMQASDDDERKKIEEDVQNIYEIADKIYERSKTSDKKIVVLLDELLNVRPNVQALVYSLVLNRFVEIGGGIKLPKNVVVVATGNSKKYSNVAEDLAKPLEKRFDHILDIEPKVGEWINEYAMPNHLHPAVIGYIISKYNESGCDENIENMGYFYEEPIVGEMNLNENGEEGWTNDPRGWDAVSTMLYNFENNVKAGMYKDVDIEDILHRTLESKLRLEWAKEFFDFYNLQTLTPEQVNNGLDQENGYTVDDLPIDINERIAFMTGLLSADESQVEECRKCIRKYCDAEYLAIYDIYWAGKDERRMEIIGEMDLMEESKFEVEDMKAFAEAGMDALPDIGNEYKSFMKSKEEEIEENDR